MTEKPEEKESQSPTKLTIDNPSDFQFHAAYLAYSEAYDKATDPETKNQLNQNITALQQNQIDYPTFYRNINQYRAVASHQHQFSRDFIKTQRKRDWRKEAQKQERNKRYRK